MIYLKSLWLNEFEEDTMVSLYLTNNQLGEREDMQLTMLTAIHSFSFIISQNAHVTSQYADGISWYYTVHTG